MYSSASPVLSSVSGSGCGGGADQHYQTHQQLFQNNNQLIGASLRSSVGGSCLKFTYFATFVLSTACLGLLSTSLATHKWIVSRPIRILRLSGGQSNATSLMLTAQSLDSAEEQHRSPRVQPSVWGAEQSGAGNQLLFLFDDESQLTNSLGSQLKSLTQSGQSNNKFQGEVYFGLFNGVRVLNHGFGDRVSQITGESCECPDTLEGSRCEPPTVVCSAMVYLRPIPIVQPSNLVVHLSLGEVYPNSQQAKDSARRNGQANQQELVNFKFWLTTLIGVGVAVAFALVSAIFAIINFVMTPEGALAGSVGLVIWNSIASLSSLLAIVSWLIEYFMRLKINVLTQEEVQNGWTSENRTQFGYSFYLVLTAFSLHLVIILIVSLVQFETWTSNKATKRQLRAHTACEGVIMLY